MTVPNYHLPAGTYAHPASTNPSRGTTVGPRFYPGQGMQNPAFMEDMYQLGKDHSIFALEH